MTCVSVTVLINTHNYGRFVGRAIESALNQQYPSAQIEILVVDDGSTDDTPQVVESYGNRIRYIRKSRGGQASAFNVGFREAHGEIVCLLDADDYFFPDKLRRVAEAFGTGASKIGQQVGLVYDQFFVVDSAGTPIGTELPEPTWSGIRIPLTGIPAQLRSLILLGHPWNGIMSIRRSILEDLVIPELVSPHNPDLFLALVLPFLTDVAIIESPVTAYVFHGGNVSLFRSSERNRTEYVRQMAYTRRFIEKRFGVRFVTYLGRSIYDADMAPRVSLMRRTPLYLKDCRQIATADVEPIVKRRSQTKLAACLLLPDRPYRALRNLRTGSPRVSSGT